MEYYYALLENYKQLKRREFKLSLREEEESEEMSDEEARQAADTAFNGAREVKPEERKDLANSDKLTFIKKSGDSGLVGALGGPFKGKPMKNVKSLDDLDDKTLSKVIGYFKNPPEDGEKDVNPDEAAKNAAAVERRDAALVKLAAEVSGMEGYYTDDYDETKTRSRMSLALSFAERQAQGETQGGEGIGGQGENAEEELKQKVISSPELSPERVAESCEVLTKSLKLVKKVQDGEDLTPEDIEALREISSKVTVTSQGVAYAGIFHQVRARSTTQNDPFRNNMKVLDDKIREFNRDNPDNKMRQIIPVETMNTGRALAYRGPMLERVAVIDGLATALAALPPGPSEQRAQLEEQLREEVQGAQGKLVQEQVAEVLQKGVCAQAQQCLLSVEQADDVTLTNTVLTYLTGIDQATGEPIEGYEGPGLSEEKAAAMIQAVINSPDKRMGVMLLVLATRGFNNAYEDLEITGAAQEGANDADIPGTKTDVLRIVSQESFEKFAKLMEENRSPIEAQQAEAAECAGEGVGMSAMRRGTKSVSESLEDIKAAVDAVEEPEEEGEEGKGKKKKKEKEAKPPLEPKEGEVALDTEQKSMDKTTGRIKSGEQSLDRFREFCNNRGKESPEEPEPADEKEKKRAERKRKTQEFYDANTKRLAGCVDNGSATKGKFGGHASAEDAACAFQEKLDNAPVLKAFSALTDNPDAVKDENGDPIEHTGAALVDQWFKSVSTNNAEDAEEAKERRKLAKSGLSKQPADRTKEENEAIKKVEQALEAAETARLMDEDTGSDDTVSGESLGYILTRHSQCAGSTSECMKDVRGYEDQDQRFGLVNENTYGSLGMVGNGSARVVRKKGSQSYSIQTTGPKPTTMVAGGFERGQLVTRVNPRTMSQPKKWKRGKEEATREELFMAFLTGQMNLLESLMNQTKNGPNI